MRPFSVHPAAFCVGEAFVCSDNEHRITFAKQLDSKGRRTIGKTGDCGILWAARHVAGGVPAYHTSPTFAEQARALELARAVHCATVVFATAIGSLVVHACRRCAGPISSLQVGARGSPDDGTTNCNDCQAVDAYLSALHTPGVTADDVSIVSQRLEWLAGQYMDAMQRVGR